MNGEQTPKEYIVRAQDSQNLRFLRMFEGAISLDAANFNRNSVSQSSISVTRILRSMSLD